MYVVQCLDYCVQPIAIFDNAPQAIVYGEKFAGIVNMSVTIYGMIPGGTDAGAFYHEILIYAPCLRNKVAQGLRILRKYFPVGSPGREEFFPGLINRNPMHIKEVGKDSSWRRISVSDTYELDRLGWLCQDEPWFICPPFYQKPHPWNK